MRVLGHRHSVLLAALSLLALPQVAVAAGHEVHTYYAVPTGGSSSGPICSSTLPCTLGHAIAVAGSDNTPSTSRVVSLAAGDYAEDTEVSITTPMWIVGPGGASPARILSTAGTAVSATVGGVRVQGLEIVNLGGYGLRLDGDAGPPGVDDSVEGVTVRALQSACEFRDVSGTITNSVCQSGGWQGLLVYAIDRDPSVTARNVTAVSSGPALSNFTSGPAGNGAATRSGSPNSAAALTLVNTIARGSGEDLFAYSDQGDSSSITPQHSNFDPGHVLAVGDGATVETGSDNQSAAPVFAGACNDDFHEAAGSPTVDHGLDAGENGDADIDGDQRQIGTTDIGADELVPPGPGDSCATSTPGEATPGGGPPAQGGEPADTLAPALASASMTNRVFAVNRAGRSEASVATHRGTTFRYALSEPARVVFTIQRAKKCKRGRKHCSRWRRFGRFAQQGAPGRNSKRWSGKIGRRAARPGRYRASLVAIDAAGNRSKAKRLRFRVVRR